jgi:hypothetical protein
LGDPTLPRIPQAAAAFESWSETLDCAGTWPPSPRVAFTAGWNAAVADGNAERELIYADLGRLADALGLGSHARPYPARQLFAECLAELAAFGERKIAEGRQRCVTRLIVMAENFADDKAAYAVLRRAADLLDGGAQ